MTQTLNSSTGRIYFPQIDGLRFIAFVLVLMHHHVTLNTMLPDTGLVNLISKIQTFGWIGVDLFLVLSSFLIFSLLLEERVRTGSISFRRFYIRRALRIWPLYFPYIILAMVVAPIFLRDETTTIGLTLHQHLLTFLTFLGNFSYAQFTSSLSQFSTPSGKMSLFAHLWTISLEEQFYFAVPLVVFFSTTVKRQYALYIAAVGMLMTMLFRWYVQSNSVPYPAVWVNPLCRTDPFIMGALAAYVLRRKANWLHNTASRIWAISAFLGIGIVISFPPLGTSLHTIWQLSLTSISAFCLVMAALSRNGLGTMLAWRPLAYLGKISFGLYVYHELVLYLFKITPLPSWLSEHSIFTWFLQLILLLSGTVSISVISYNYYERRFLKLKERFETVHSRPA